MKKTNYIAPEIEAISVTAELGFAASVITSSGLNDYTWDNGTSEDE